jgi:MscS family membrane protein
MNYTDYMDYLGFLNIFDLPPAALILAGIIILISILLRRVFTKFVIKGLKNLCNKNHLKIASGIVDTFEKPLSFCFLILGLYVASKMILLPLHLAHFMDYLLHSLITFTFFWAIYRTLDSFSIFFDVLPKTFHAKVSAEMHYFFASIFKALTVFIGVMAILQSWGINVAAFLGGLGLVGMAVALAAQETLKNLFGSLSIFMDGTFHKGDHIKIGDVEGNIEKIGLRTTKIRQADRALVVVPNASLVNSAVVNFSRRPLRRIQWNIPLEGDTASEKLETVIPKIRKFLEGFSKVETNPTKAKTLIYLDQFVDGSINLYCEFFSKSPDLEYYLSVKHECLLAFKHLFEMEGIKLTHTGHHHSIPLNPQISQKTKI